MNDSTETSVAPALPRGLLPADDALRAELHNEVHARPSARIRLPALVVYVAVLNEGVSREQECEHLRRLPGQQGLSPDQMQGNFLRLRLPGYTLKWERHTEFTRYSIVQALPVEAGLGASDPHLLEALATPPGWLRDIPGRTIAAIQLVMLHAELPEQTPQAQARLMGLDVDKMRVRLVLAVCLLTGMAVALCGVIGFVGLVGPHVARMLVGEDLNGSPAKPWLTPLSAPTAFC